MIYLDNAATSFPKPRRVVDAVRQALSTFGSPSRGAHGFSLAATRAVESARANIARLFNCPDPARIAFAKNVTEALNLAISSVDGHIVSSEAEHNSVLRPLFRRGNLGFVPLDDSGRYSLDDVKRACRPDTAAVVLAHASNLTGNLAPVEAIGRFCRERGLLFILDAAQTAGLIDIDMEALGLDALCFTGHKSLCGPQGTGGICLGARFRPRPLMTGGSGSRSFETVQPEELPDLLEAGTQNAHGLAGLAAGVEYVLEKTPAGLWAGADRLARAFHRRLAASPGIVFYGDYAEGIRMPIVTLNIGDLPSGEVAGELWERHGIAVRSGAHCAPLLHRRFGTAGQGAVRFSFSHRNTDAEMAEAAGAVEGICRRRFGQ